MQNVVVHKGAHMVIYTRTVNLHEQTTFLLKRLEIVNHSFSEYKVLHDIANKLSMDTVTGTRCHRLLLLSSQFPPKGALNIPLCLLVRLSVAPNN